MIGAGNAKEEAPEEEAPEEEAVGSLLPVDGLLGGGVVGCVGINGLAAAFGEDDLGSGGNVHGSQRRRERAERSDSCDKCRRT